MIVKFGINKMVFLLFLGVIFVLASFSLSFAQVFFLSSDIPATIGSATFDERDIIYYEASNFSLHLSGSDLGIPNGVNIDALGFSGSDIFFSVDIPIFLNGVTYTERDVILYDGDDFSKLLDGSAVGIPDAACIDAATVLSGGNIIFSLDIPVTLGEISFKAHDLVIYDGFSFGRYFSGSDNGIPEAANLDGVWVNPEGEILFSLDIPCNFNGLEAKDKDIIKWSQGSFSTYFEGFLAGLPSGAGVNAVSSEIESYEGDFDKDGDVDGSDLSELALKYGNGMGQDDLDDFAEYFGMVESL